MGKPGMENLVWKKSQRLKYIGADKSSAPNSFPMYIKNNTGGCLNVVQTMIEVHRTPWTEMSSAGQRTS
jgi:hypothetical protein